MVTFPLSTMVSAHRRTFGYMARRTSEGLVGFGLRLYEARHHGDREITHAQIAKAVSLSRVAVTKWEGKAEPAIKPTNLYALATFLEVRPRWLATGAGPKEIELKSEATRLAEDWSTLPVEYQAAIRKHTDDLLAAIALMPGLRRPLGDERVGKFIKPARHSPEPQGPARPPLYQSDKGLATAADLKVVKAKKSEPKAKKKP